MIEKDESANEMAVQCDVCTNLSDVYPLDDFRGAIETVREAGWKVTRDPNYQGGWTHTCPDHFGPKRVAEQRRLLGL